MSILVVLISLLKVLCYLSIVKNNETTKTPGDYVLRTFDKKFLGNDFARAEF
jgi:hypothetical protein